MLTIASREHCTTVISNGTRLGVRVEAKGGKRLMGSNNKLVEKMEEQIIQVLDRDGPHYRKSIEIWVRKSLPDSLNPLALIRRKMAFRGAMKELIARDRVIRSADGTYRISKQKEEKDG